MAILAAFTRAGRPRHEGFLCKLEEWGGQKIRISKDPDDEFSIGEATR